MMLAVLSVSVLTQRNYGAGMEGSFEAADSLALPGEVYVIESDYLQRLNIDTLDDILQIVPGASFWREGVPGSKTGFSICGERAQLLVNGRLKDNIYTSEPLIKFIDLARLKRVEVIYRGGLSLTGELNSGKAVNLIVEEGGRETPFTQAKFTYGGNNRRSRRIWFSTPRSHISAAVSYNEYLQDAMESVDFGQNRLIGKDHIKSIAFEVCLGREADAVMHLTRFEDAFNGTACDRYEEIRTSGFDSWIDYARGGFRGSIRHRGIERLRDSGRMSGLCSDLDIQMNCSLGDIDLRGFLKGRNYLLENRFGGLESDPRVHNYYGGITLHTRAADRYPVRGSVFLGHHSEAEGYPGWELGAGREGKGGAYQSISVSRRPDLPSVAQLFHPLSAGDYPECLDVVSAGFAGLNPAITEELSLENSFRFGLMLNLFHRRIHSAIKENAEGSLVNSAGRNEVSGIRAGLDRSFAWRRFDLRLEAGGEYFFDRSGLGSGIPEYGAVGNLYLSFPIFKETEVMTIHLNSIVFGEREWNEQGADPAAVHNFSLSMTLMSALVRFQYKNILNTEYQTVPGYFMAERHFRVGILWNLPD